MLVGSSEVESKKIPFATFLLIIISIFGSAKAYMLECTAHNARQQQFFGSFSNHQPAVSYSEKAKEVEQFHHDYGFKITDFKEGNFLSLFTHIFIHTDPIELVANMLALWVFAIAMEELLGSIGFLALYFTGGILAALAQGFCDLETTCPLIGASGAVGAVMAAYLVNFGSFSTVRIWGLRIMGHEIREMPAQIFCALWLYSQVKGLFAGASAIDVALVANLTGFGLGLVFGKIVSGSLADRIVTTKSGEVVIDSGKKVEKTGSQKLDEVLETQPFSLVAQAFADKNVPCPKCGDSLDLQNPVGDRLVRCSGKCSQMTYVDGQVLAGSFSSQQA